jgi:predicted transcriptional regulator
MAKRAKLEIMRDILKIIKENKGVMKPTPLLRKVGLSTSGFKEYYDVIKERGLVNEVTDKELTKQIVLTEKGNRFLERYKTIIEFIDEFDL